MQKSKDTAELLQMFPLFEGIAPDELEYLGARAEFIKFKKHENVYQSGERSDCLLFLIKGVVKIGRYSADGREIIKHVLHPMSMFGELCLAGELKRKDFAMAIKKDTQILKIQMIQLQQVMRRDSKLSMRVLNFIGNRLQNVEQRLESLIFKDARERIIEFLKDAARKQGKRVGYETLIKHALTQQDIANITGTSRQTVTSVMNDLRKSNLIYFNRRTILIRDLGKLA
ncbi:MAG: Crp/Fnr family transcriptional regulator [Phaeodactylibacter sp.]|uniref:Crp/Fnr family transcriptional regulator n=1 Tax=Phaeodactylibacter sp. TaxID=1940289 RepID=UPI0032EFFC57